MESRKRSGSDTSSRSKSSTPESRSRRRMIRYARYVGDGAWTPGIPARNLTEEEIQIYGAELIAASPLWIMVETEIKEK